MSKRQLHQSDFHGSMRFDGSETPMVSVGNRFLGSDSVLQGVLKRLRLELDAECCFIVEFDEAQQVVPIRFQSTSRHSPDGDLSGHLLSDEVVACLQSKFLQRLSWAVDIQGNEPDEFYRWSKESCNARSIISCPVTSDNGAKGILILYTVAPRQWTAEDLDKVQDCAHSLQLLLGSSCILEESSLPGSYVEESLWNFFASGAVGFQWIGVDGQVLRVNQAALEMLGYNSHDYVGQSFTRFCVDRLEGEDILHRFMNTESLRCYPVRLLCKDGTVKIVQISTGTFRKGDTVQYTRCLMRDATSEQARIEKIVQQSQERYWSLYEWEKKTREVLQIIRQSFELDRVFPIAIAEMAKVLQANRAFIVEFDEEAVCPIKYEYRSHPSVKSFKGMVPPWDFCPYLAISARNEMAYSFDTYNDTSVPSNAQWEKFSRQYDIQSIVAAPILYKNRLMNVIVFHTLKPRQWNEQELFFIKVLSEHLSSVFYQERQRQEYIQVLKDKTQALTLLAQECQEPFRAIINYAKQAKTRMDELPVLDHDSALSLAYIADNAERWQSALDSMATLSNPSFWLEKLQEYP